MSTQRGFFMPGDPGTPQIPEIWEAGEIRKTPFPRRNGKSDESPPAIRKDSVHIGRGMAVSRNGGRGATFGAVGLKPERSHCV